MKRWRALVTVVAMVGGGALLAFVVALVRRALGRRPAGEWLPAGRGEKAAAKEEVGRAPAGPHEGDASAATVDLIIGDTTPQPLPPDLSRTPTVAERLMPAVRDPEEVVASLVPSRAPADPFAGAGGIRLAIALVLLTAALVAVALTATGRL